MSRTDRIIGSLAGRPAGDPTWDDDCVLAYDELAEGLNELKLSKDQLYHRRGDYPALSTGISYGGGQTEPAELLLHETNRPIVKKLCRGRGVHRMSGFMNATFAMGSPKMYKNYEFNMGEILEHHPDLHLPYDNSIRAATTFNFGPRAFTKIHIDSANLPSGWCSIASLGEYNPRTGGHIILHHAKLIIEFPPHSVAHILSGSFPHENIPIGENETRASITQYTAGGLFRRVAYGHRTEQEFESQDPAGKAAMDASRRQRWHESVALFSKYDELAADIEKVFNVK
ncbi:hypothetical protein FA95DRAFT_1583857 [Auriscalpium vulgare]|uniref:Uncharacterized protein n=1 Tax=Auriscalpium vulgare TaxID=40419 RepID=A0ACB8RKE3_9AGAM|nr:hypothetical protein FA95DRAFT_1583857 [Auriscalpium vulgare]